MSSVSLSSYLKRVFLLSQANFNEYKLRDNKSKHLLVTLYWQLFTIKNKYKTT